MPDAGPSPSEWIAAAANLAAAASAVVAAVIARRGIEREHRQALDAEIAAVRLLDVRIRVAADMFEEGVRVHAGAAGSNSATENARAMRALLKSVRPHLSDPAVHAGAARVHADAARALAGVESILALLEIDLVDGKSLAMSLEVHRTTLGDVVGHLRGIAQRSGARLQVLETERSKLPG